MSFRQIEYDPVTGVRELFDYDWKTDTSVIRTVQHVSPTLDLNKTSRNDETQKWRGKNNDFWKVGSIPLVVLHQWMVEEGINFMTKEGLQRIKRKLDDPNWAYLKTAPVRLGRAKT